MAEIIFISGVVMRNLQQARVVTVLCLTALVGLSACGDSRPGSKISDARTLAQKGQNQAAIVELKNVLQ